MNDVEEGGSTGFKNIGKQVEAKKGRMVVFDNVNKKNEIYKRSLHAGLPIIKGENGRLIYGYVKNKKII